MKKFKFDFVTIAVAVLFIFSCKKNNVDPNKYPTTESEIEASSKITQEISVQAQGILSSALSTLSSTDSSSVHQGIIKQIKTINGVKDAYINSSGSVVVLEQTNGFYSNLLVVDPTDANQLSYKVNNVPNLKTFAFGDDINDYQLTQIGSHVTTTGQKKAAIIAPFMSAFHENFDDIEFLLTDLGYDFDVFCDDKADLSVFNGDFLQQYDIIYISSHGAANAVNSKGQNYTAITTGQPFDAIVSSAIPPDLRVKLTVSTPPNQTEQYFGVTSDYLQATLTKKFSNSWVYINACQSFMLTDLSNFFLQNGALAYNGYRNTTMNYFSQAVAVKMFSSFASGFEFNDAYKIVENDPGLKEYSYFDIKTNVTVNINLFASQKNTTENFNIRDDVFGEVITSPQSATVGTNVLVGAHIFPFLDYGFEDASSLEGNFIMSYKDGSIGGYEFLHSNNPVTIVKPEDNVYPKADLFKVEEGTYQSNGISKYCYDAVIINK
jgi:hypothetical protein